MKNLQLISIKEHSKKDKRNKLNKLYNWYIERYNQNIELVSFMDVLPKQPKKYGIQLLKSEIILEINSRNIFDFTFEPENEDFLVLTNINDCEDFLSLSFFNENWYEDFRLTISNRNQIIQNGIFKLVE